MATSSLLDLAVDLLNEAKNARDSKSKLFYLEQIREILLHRFVFTHFFFNFCFRTKGTNFFYHAGILISAPRRLIAISCTNACNDMMARFATHMAFQAIMDHIDAK